MNRSDTINFILTGNFPEESPSMAPNARRHYEHMAAEATTPAVPPVADPKPDEPYTLNRDKSVAVATDYFTNEDMSQCPRGCKVYLVGKGGVGVLATYDGDPFWIEWAPLPKRRNG